MAIVTIVKAPNPLLDKPTETVEQFGKNTETAETIKDLKDTLDAASEPEGAGLSANQIGINKNVCVVRKFFQDPMDPNTQLFEEKVLINPKITNSSKETETDWEGCLSVPDTYGKVTRPTKIQITYQDESSTSQKLIAEGFYARVIQHEIDHLNGILFTSKVEGNTVTGDYFKDN
ncbi:peptide deformylase [candidate division WWE3 bacterium]|nr:peptide deformylase [candidate division WWE3 bacterium]